MRFQEYFSKDYTEVVDVVALAKIFFGFVSGRDLTSKDGFFSFPGLDGKRLNFNELASQTAQLAMYVLPQLKFLECVWSPASCRLSCATCAGKPAGWSDISFQELRDVFFHAGWAARSEWACGRIRVSTFAARQKKIRWDVGACKTFAVVVSIFWAGVDATLEDSGSERCWWETRFAGCDLCKSLRFLCGSLRDAAQIWGQGGRGA